MTRGERLEAYRRPIIALLVLLGIAERILWNVLRPTSGAAGEAMNVATAIGSGRGFADAYRVGQGATAHLLPISPGIAGGVYRLVGVGSPAAETVLACWSIGLAMGAYLLLFRAFGRLGTPLWARLGALGFGCLAPAYIGAEAVDFRVWEGGLAVFLAALFLDRLLAASEREAATSTLIGAGALNALLFFVNPPMGVAAYACAAVFSLRHLRWRRMLIPVGASLAALLLLLAPWAARNQRALGQPILLRSNAGLELALANYPGATEDGDRKQQFLTRLAAIHPVGARPYVAMVAAGGEVAYARGLGAEATTWMRAHPGDVARLMLRHLRQSLVPEAWQFDVFGRSLSPRLRASTIDLASLAGLAGIVLALMGRRRHWVYPALLTATLALLSSPFQPVTRYTYLFYPTLVFCAGDLIAALTRRNRARLP